jgi:hypothetical protein
MTDRFHLANVALGEHLFTTGRGRQCNVHEHHDISEGTIDCLFDHGVNLERVEQRRYGAGNNVGIDILFIVGVWRLLLH